MLVIEGVWAVAVVVIGFVAALIPVGRFPNQFGMFLWTRRNRRDDED
jgi:hypothetical protein